MNVQAKENQIRGHAIPGACVTSLELLMNLLMGLLVEGISSKVHDADQKAMDAALKDREKLKEDLASWRSLPDTLSAACAKVVRARKHLGMPAQEAAVGALLVEPIFQKDLYEWLVAGAIEEGRAARERLVTQITGALTRSGASAEHLSFVQERYFAAIEREVFADPLLAAWRHQASLDYLREQVGYLRQLAEEAAGHYSLERQAEVLNRYCAVALRHWDIVDLNNLPQEDVDIATQALLLRQLYQPLRVTVEQRGVDADALDHIERRRASWRRWESGSREDAEAPPEAEERVPVGQRIAAAQRLVVLGDPGAGKTTLLRWMATAYLLRRSEDPALRALPDVDTLPETGWIPVLIRCRELGPEDLSRCFSDFLAQHLRRSDLLPGEADVMRAVILDRMARGEVLLLVDGLDEITDPQVRILLCKELEQTAARYPVAHILVTSRVVGYRDMPYRMGRDFEHCVVTPLTAADKDEFARRWVRATDRLLSTADQEARVTDLMTALHSSDRIERLASNPMMLTTLALVKRKVGKLPSRRTKLYREAVSVLLNWNPTRYDVIEEEEAVPQLAYVAWEMCRRGVQRLKEEELLDLIDQVRREYPNVRAMRRHSPEEFLARIEARSSLLIKAGGTWDKDLARSWPVWEFRHLTFQEYLAARALLDKRYPGREKGRTLAQVAGMLAGSLEPANSAYEAEVQVHESWRETLRLLVADAPDDEVDDILIAILEPMNGEDREATEHPRAVEAALCLADEPNISEDTADRILQRLVANVKQLDGTGQFHTSLGLAAEQVDRSAWGPRLRRLLAEQFRDGAPELQIAAGSLCAMLSSLSSLDALHARLSSPDVIERCMAILGCMQLAYEGRDPGTVIVVPILMHALRCGGREAAAAIWALGWLVDDHISIRGPLYVTSDDDVAAVVSYWSAVRNGDDFACRWCQDVLRVATSPNAIQAQVEGTRLGEHVRVAALQGLSNYRRIEAAPHLLPLLAEADPDIVCAVVKSLGTIADPASVALVAEKLGDESTEIILAAVEALLRIGKAVLPILLPLLLRPEYIFGASAVLFALGDRRGLPGLNDALSSQDPLRRTTAVKYLTLAWNGLDRHLVVVGGYPEQTWLDPALPVDDAWVQHGMTALGLGVGEIRARYEALAPRLGLILPWKSAPSEQ